jgi:predicted secreted protein
MKTRYIVLIGVGAAAAVAASFVAGPIIRNFRYGTQFPVQATKDASPEVIVKQGDKFSIVVRDNASIGDNWWLKSKPDYATAALDHDEYVSESSSDSLGGGGRRYYTFTARTPGNSQIVLVNTFQGGKQTFTVTVRLTITG